MKIKNKKALLLGEHVVNILIAVLCILVLVYLGFQVYNLYIGAKQENEQAKYTLGQMSAKISSLIADNSRQEEVYRLVNPKDWFLRSYNTTDKNLPRGCNGNCLCFCNKIECTDLAECITLSLSKNVRVNNTEYAQDLSCDPSVPGKICLPVGYQNTLSTSRAPMELKFKKTGEEILIQK